VRANIVKIQSQPFQKRGPNFLTFVLFGVLATFRGFLGLWQPQKVKLQLADAPSLGNGYPESEISTKYLITMQFYQLQPLYVVPNP